MKYAICTLLVFTTLSIKAQNSRFSVDVHYGPQANFSVGDYDEEGWARHGYAAFFNKKMIGQMTGVDVVWRLGKQWGIGVGYSRSVNARTISFNDHTAPAVIEDFTIRDVNKFFHLYYNRDFRRPKSLFSLQAGLFYVRPYQQEVAIDQNMAWIEERNFQNSRLEEGGAFLGIAFSKKIDTRFHLGMKSRLYYMISQNVIEAVTLTPFLQYQF